MVDYRPLRVFTQGYYRLAQEAHAENFTVLAGGDVVDNYYVQMVLP